MAFENLYEGIELSRSKQVEEKDTAVAYGSGNLKVFATPAMIALMEQACLELVKPQLPEGYDTVGTHVDIKHVKATPQHQKVECTARLIEINGPKLKFQVEARDENGQIGVGTHKRYAVEAASFMKNLK
ncbi:MAG: thioesterase family protein [Bacteroidales bacterium]|nr:thioesterase family protein [Bacteroidales bacterium]MCF8336796.1 thioesterase family protein [Bacteroidales bacterium]